MAQVISNFIQTSSSSTLVASAFDGLIALEMALRTIVDLGKKLSKSKDGSLDRDLSADLGGTIFYGLAAANLFPGSAKLGISIFIGYSFFSDCKSKKDAYFLAKLVDRLASSFVDHVLNPICEKISSIAKALLTWISLPKNPIWFGVVALIAAIFVYQFGVPSISSIGPSLKL